MSVPFIQDAISHAKICIVTFYSDNVAVDKYSGSGRDPDDIQYNLRNREGKEIMQMSSSKADFLQISYQVVLECAIMAYRGTFQHGHYLVCEHWVYQESQQY